MWDGGQMPRPAKAPGSALFYFPLESETRLNANATHCCGVASSVCRTRLCLISALFLPSVFSGATHAREVHTQPSLLANNKLIAAFDVPRPCLAGDFL